MFIGDKNKDQRRKNRLALESERVEEINLFFDKLNETISELYESVMDEEIELNEVNLKIIELCTSQN